MALVPGGPLSKGWTFLGEHIQIKPVLWLQPDFSKHNPIFILYLRCGHVGLGRTGTSSYCSEGDVLDLFLFQARSVRR